MERGERKKNLGIDRRISETESMVSKFGFVVDDASLVSNGRFCIIMERTWFITRQVWFRFVRGFDGFMFYGEIEKTNQMYQLS